MRLLDCLLLLGVFSCATALQFSVTVSPDIYKPDTKGRVILYISTNNDSVPLAQGSDGPDTAQLFGVDAFDLAAGQVVAFDEKVLGYPRESLSDVPPGTYFVQAEFKLYDVVRINPYRCIFFICRVC